MRYDLSRRLRAQGSGALQVTPGLLDNRILSACQTTLLIHLSQPLSRAVLAMLRLHYFFSILRVTGVLRQGVTCVIIAPAI
jgi:hypothetical protein